MNLQCLDDEDIRVICDLVFGSLNFPQQLKSSSARIKRCFLWGLLAFQLLITYSYFMRSNHARIISKNIYHFFRSKNNI